MHKKRMRLWPSSSLLPLPPGHHRGQKTLLLEAGIHDALLLPPPAKQMLVLQIGAAPHARVVLGYVLPSPRVCVPPPQGAHRESRVVAISSPEHGGFVVELTRMSIIFARCKYSLPGSYCPNFGKESCSCCIRDSMIQVALHILPCESKDMFRCTNFGSTKITRRGEVNV